MKHENLRRLVGSSMVFLLLAAGCGKDEKSTGWQEAQILGAGSLNTLASVSTNSSGKFFASWLQLSEQRSADSNTDIAHSSGAYPIDDNSHYTVEKRFSVRSSHKSSSDWSSASTLGTGTWQLTGLLGFNVNGQLAEKQYYDPPILSKPAIAVDDNGQGVAVWAQLDSNGILQLFYSVNSSGSWTTASTLVNSATHKRHPQLVLNGTGEGVAIWEEVASTGENTLYAARFRNATDSFDAPVMLSGLYNGKPEQAGQAVISGNTNYVVVVWEQTESTAVEADQEIFAQQYTYSTDNWNVNPTQINDATLGHASRPRVSINASNVAFAAWQQEDSSDVMHVHGAGLNALTAIWSTSIPLQADLASTSVNETTLSASQVDVVVHSDGIIEFVWLQHNNDDSLLPNKWNNHSNWEVWTGSLSTYLDTLPSISKRYSDRFDAVAPIIAEKNASETLLVWKQRGDLSHSLYDLQSLTLKNGAVSHKQLVASNLSDRDQQIDLKCANDNAVLIWQAQDGGVYTSYFAND